MDHQIFEESMKNNGQRPKQINKKVMKEKEKKIVFININVLTEIRKSMKQNMMLFLRKEHSKNKKNSWKLKI